MYTQENWVAEFCRSYNNKEWDICANLLDAKVQDCTIEFRSRLVKCIRQERVAGRETWSTTETVLVSKEFRDFVKEWRKA